MSSSQSKIFGVGLSKTGTTSLACALDILGYRTRDYLGVSRYRTGDLSSIDLDEINLNDAFTDTPIPSFYRELDVKYPGSKFILTVRDRDAWLKSCKKQFTKKHAEKQNEASNLLFMDLYGCTEFDELKFIKGYEDHVSSVLDYFKSRPQDLLILDITTEDGWGKLSRFLGVPEPDIPFPRANVTQIRWMNVNDIIDVARLAGKEILAAYEIIQASRTGQGGPGPGQAGIVRSVLGKASYILHGGAAGLQKAAVKNACKIMTRRLRELNPQIPVISPLSNDVPYVQRSKWNHFWLVDPLDGELRCDDSEATFTINIALIEDRKPNVGVIFAPVQDAAYYASAGNVAFKIDHGGDPQRIERQDSPDQTQSRLPSEGQQNNSPDIMSKALAICLIAEGISHSTSFQEDTMEWQTAGAHAILNSTGMKIISRATKEELTYNKESFSNGPVAIE